MGEQHLDALAVAAGLLEGLCTGERTGDVAGRVSNDARHKWLRKTLVRVVGDY